MPTEQEFQIENTAFEQKVRRFMLWKGDEPAPQFTHWDSRGTFIIRACTPSKTSSVHFRTESRERLLGHDDISPTKTADHLFRGSFDPQLGFAANTILPATLKGWNDLGG